jgi:hypothetical protein
MRFAPALRFLRRSSAPARVHADPADMGTAFGMEASLEDSTPSTSPSYGILESQRAHPPLDNPMDWMRQRRKSS